MFAQDIISGWRYLTKGIKKLIFMSKITLVSTIFQDIAPKLIVKTLVLNNGDKQQNDLASSSLVSVRSSVLVIPTRDTHFTRDLGMGISKTRGYPNHCDIAKCSDHRTPATQQFKKKSHHHRKQKIARIVAAEVIIRVIVTLMMTSAQVVETLVNVTGLSCVIHRLMI